MLVEADRVFVKTSPLAELVWSPRKGLRLQCADSGSPDDRSSLWWSTDLFDVVAAGPDRHGNVKLLENSNLSPQSVTEMNCELDSANDRSEASHKEMERLSGKNEMFITDEDTAIDEIRGCDNAKVDGSLSSDHVPIDMDHVTSDKGSLLENEVDARARDVHALEFAEGLDLKCNASENAAFHLHSIDKQRSGNSEKGSDAREDDLNNRIHPQLTYFHPLGNQKLILGNTSYDQDLSIFTPLPSSEGRGTDIETQERLDNIQNETQNAHLIITKAIRTSENEEQNMLVRKGKEKTEESGDANMDINRESCHGPNHLNEMDDGHVSIKSNNYKELSTGKREHCSETTESSRKKFKQLKNNGKPFHGTLLRQDSSFLNWISGLAKTLPSSAQADTPMSLVPKISTCEPKNHCPSLPLDKGKDLSPSADGFRSFVQTLHHPDMKTQQMVPGDVDDQNLQSNGVHLKELQIPNKQFVSAGCSDIQVSTDLDLHQPIPLATLGLDKRPPVEMVTPAGTNHFGDLLSQEKKQYLGLNSGRLCNFESSSSSFRLTPMDPQNMVASKPDSIVRSSNLLLVDGGSEFLGSFWITRLSPRPPLLSLSAQNNQVLTPATEIPHDGQILFPTHPSDHESLGGTKCSENVHITPTEDLKKNTVTYEGHSVSCSGSSSKEVAMDGGKPKMKLNPILPSKRLKQLEPLTSVFAKRLDAFKHIKPSNIIHDVLYSDLLCIFCGKSGHNMRDCTLVTGTELETLQKNINSYDGAKETSCLCIRCFQLDHWATECPFSLGKIKFPGIAPRFCPVVNFERMDGQLTLEDKSRKGERYEREHPKNLVIHNISDGEVKFSNPNTKKIIPGDSNYKGKDVLISSILDEGRGNQIAFLYSSAKRGILDESTQIFEGIRRLRLSRTDLVRLMGTPISGLNIEGFFLRVRLGKQEEVAEKGGYQVARISGALQEKSFGRIKNHIPVNIGSVKCLIDCRFISNNDFAEDELTGWWSEILKSGSTPPTEEELAKKLKERKRFGI